MASSGELSEGPAIVKRKTLLNGVNATKYVNDYDGAILCDGLESTETTSAPLPPERHPNALYTIFLHS